MSKEIIILGEKDTAISDRFSFRRTTYTRDGEEKTWVSLRSQDSVHIVAITPEHELLVVKQFRIPVNDYVYELPAGLLDKEGESPIDCARRELLEETGYKANDMSLLAAGVLSPGIMSQTSYVFYTTDITHVTDNVGVDNERIEVVKFPINLDGLKETVDKITFDKSGIIDFRLRLFISICVFDYHHYS